MKGFSLKPLVLKRFSLETSIALSFLRKPGSRMPSFTALVSVVGVAVGVAAFIVVVTVFNSFETQLKQTLLGANPNLVVHNFPKGIPDVQALKAELAALMGPEVKSMSLFEYNEVLLNKDTNTATVIVKAIEGTQAASSVDLKKYIDPPESLALLDNAVSLLASGVQSHDGSALPPVILGKGLALRLGAKPGDTVHLSSGTFGYAGKNVYQSFKVVGYLAIGLAQYDDKLAFIGFLDGVSLFGEPGHAKGVEISLHDPNKAQSLAQALESKIPYQLRPWQDIDQSLFRQIERDGQAVRLIVLIITLVAAFNIIVTLTLSVVDRSKQIATLRSLGARRYHIIRVFVTTGCILGSLGAGLGLLISIAILQFFAGFELGELKAFYFVDRIPVTYDLTLMLAAFLAAIVLSFVSACYPAYKATLVSPLHGLKPWT